MLLAPLRRHDPRAIHKRRLMPHVLAMAAGQIGHPVAKFIEMIADNRLIHDRVPMGSVLLSTACTCLPFFKRQFRTFSR